MGWLLSFASAVIAAIVGCGLAFFLAGKCVAWYRLGNFEGGSGYFVIFMAFFGLVGGFTIGFVVAKNFGTGFMQGAALGLGVLAVVLGLIGLWARMGGDVPPRIDGDTLEMMVEMRMAPHWQPSNLALAGENSCTLTSIGGSERRRPEFGLLNIQQATRRDGRWVVPCEVSVHSGREPLLVGMQLGKKTQFEFVSPLPGRPEPKHEQWSDWNTAGFAVISGQPPHDGYSYRVRVKRNAIAYAEKLAAQTAEEEQRKNGIAALNGSSPLKNWLPYATDYRRDAIAGTAERYLQTRIGEMAGPLQDDDITVVLQTIKFLEAQKQIPAALHAPLVTAGRRVLPLIAKAKLATDPDDPDQVTAKLADEFGRAWLGAAAKTGLPMDEIRAEIQEAASYAQAGEIYSLAHIMRTFRP